MEIEPFYLNYQKKANFNSIIDTFFDGQGTDNLFSVIMSILILNNDPYVSQNLIIDINNFFSEYDDENFIFLDKTVYDLFGISKDCLTIFSDFFANKFGTPIAL